MSSTLKYFLLLISIFITTTSALTRAPFKPNALFLSVHRDNATSLHVTQFRKRTPEVSVPLVVDINGRFLWVTCDQNYLSSTYNAPICHSTQCASAGVHYCHKCSANARPGCHNNTCAVMATNPMTQKNAISELAQNVVSIQSTNGHQWANISHFIFACAPSSLLNGSTLPQGVQGIAGFGHTPVALPLQLASRSGFEPQFSMCLGSPRNKNPNIGAIFFGNVPPNVRPKSLARTPLTIGAQGEFYILIRDIQINNQTVPFNTSLLSTTRGFGGSMISTTTPYTVLHHFVFESLTRFYAKQLTNVSQVQAISPFGMCFDFNAISVGAPSVDFVMQNRNVTWRVSGNDALVSVRPNVSCLAFVDGGSNTRAMITIGAYQLENNFLHFDLLRSRLGFVPSRIEQPMDCSRFNFTGDHSVEMDVMGD